MKKLINILTEQTQSLKVQYIKQTEKWAKEQYLRNIQRRNDYYSKKIKDYPEKYLYFEEQRWVFNSPSYIFTEGFVSISIKNAELHYEMSIEKLAYRILKKGLDIDNINVKTSHIGVNIETIITDHNKTVKAFTVLAYGEVQRPHYRYLIK